MSSYKEWEAKCTREAEKVVEAEEEEVEAVVEEAVAEPPGMTETVEQIKKLCRVCSSNGLISIHTQISRMSIHLRVSISNTRDWDVTIGEIIAQLSGTEVSSSDSLPQFICQHCLGYLQHAYVIRLRIIRNTENLKQAQQIADDDSLGLEACQLDQKRITKREIEDSNEAAIEEEHFFETFKGANIKITPNVLRSSERAIEKKCPWCEKRVMSTKSLTDHMEVCETSVLDAFFTAYQTITSRRKEKELTSIEFILHAIRLVFDTQKKLQQIVKAKKIDVNAISPYIPLGPAAITFSANQPMRNYQSPDNGYASGPK